MARLDPLTGQPLIALNPEFGFDAPRTVAVSDENWCIGCMLCIKVCPTDAILGSNKLMHTVIEPYCTGCELCLPVCPVDCILLENVSDSATGWDAWSAAQADTARERYAFHQARQQRDLAESDKRLEAKAIAKLSNLEQHSLHTDPAVLDKKRAVIEAAMARARAKRPPGSGAG